MVADPTISSPESSFFTLGLIFLLILVCFALSCLLLGSMSMRGLIIAAARKTNLYNSCNLTQHESHLIARIFFICFPLSISSGRITQNFKSDMSWRRYAFRMGIIFEIISFFRCRRSFEATTRRRRLLRSSLCSSSYLQKIVFRNIF